MTQVSCMLNGLHRHGQLCIGILGFLLEHEHHTPHLKGAKACNFLEFRQLELRHLILQCQQVFFNNNDLGEHLGDGEATLDVSHGNHSVIAGHHSFQQRLAPKNQILILVLGVQ